MLSWLSEGLAIRYYGKQNGALDQIYNENTYARERKRKHSWETFSQFCLFIVLRLLEGFPIL